MIAKSHPGVRVRRRDPAISIVDFMGGRDLPRLCRVYDEQDISFQSGCPGISIHKITQIDVVRMPRIGSLPVWLCPPNPIRPHPPPHSNIRAGLGTPPENPVAWICPGLQPRGDVIEQVRKMLLRPDPTDTKTDTKRVRIGSFGVVAIYAWFPM